MNERLKELAEQAGFQEYFLSNGYIVRDQELERFAERVRQDEREVCAKLCDDREQSNLYGVKECANAIRARSNNRTKTSKDICGNE